MAKTIDEAFDIMARWVAASSSETERARQHRKPIDGCLENKLGMSHSFRSGSFGNGTNVARYSDVDLFAVFPGPGLSSSSDYVLQTMRKALKERFPNTDVRVRAPVVVVPFGKEEQDTFEIVPAKYIDDTDSGFRIYHIPNRFDGWMRSSPSAHNDYINRVDKKLDGRVKPLIRLMKAWKFYNAVPIRSFYLEMRTARYAADETTIIYRYDVEGIFSHLDLLGLAPIVDPTGVSGKIYAGTEAQVEEAKSKVDSALRRASNAMVSEKNGKIGEAFYWWNRVLNDEFPGYY